MNLPTFERNLAITDVEFTGLDPDKHEIIEIGMLLVRQGNFEIIDEFEAKVKPERIETADPESLKIAGYNEDEWQDALPLQQAMAKYAEKVEGAMLLAHPLTMDWVFLEHAFRKTNIEKPMDYHQLDLFSMAWVLMREDEALPKVSLFELAKFFGIDPEPSPHRALNGARIAYDVLIKLLEYHRNLK